ncbi:MAG: hypothetical protein R3E61_09300 [Pseudomonadales bacterium]
MAQRRVVKLFHPTINSFPPSFGTIVAGSLPSTALGLDQGYEVRARAAHQPWRGWRPLQPGAQFNRLGVGRGLCQCNRASASACARVRVMSAETFPSPVLANFLHFDFGQHALLDALFVGAGEVDVLDLDGFVTMSLL